MIKGTVLLLNPPAHEKIFRDNGCTFESKAGYYWPPTDLLVLSGILSVHYEVDVIDAVAEGIKAHACLEKMCSKNYQAIIFLTATTTCEQDLELVRKAKERTGTMAIALGGIVTAEGQRFLEQFDFLDAIIFDHTSGSVVRFLNGDHARLEGMAFRDHGQITTVAIRTDEVISYPVPLHTRFPLSHYRVPIAWRRPFSCVITSFGCPFSCRFCIGSLYPYKARAIDNIEEELIALNRQGIREVYFCDFTFTAIKERTRALCQRMIDRGIDLGWSCNIHASTVDREELRLMKQAGCHTVLIGVESGNDSLLDRYAKGTNIALLEKVFQWCKELGIETVGYFIIGLPGETDETIEETIRFACKLDPDFASFSRAFTEKGTSLWNESEAAAITLLDNSTVQRALQRAYRRFYLRPAYFLRTLFRRRTWLTFIDQIFFGITLVRKQVLSKK